MSETNTVKLNENIFYLPASDKPLSCDVVFIKTNETTWIFDVGSNKESSELINSVEGKKNIVISHFHPDHTFNLLKVNYDNLYVTKYTKKYTIKGTIVESVTKFDENPEITILELPSSHAKGCLCLVCGEYAFLGDGTYAKPKKGNHVYNAQLLKQMIDVLESLDVKYFCLSHDENFVQNKDAVIKLYKAIYSRRSENNPIISVEDFFNSDGSVKPLDEQPVL